MPRSRIQLNHLTPIASGNNRDVFAHPDNPDLLIKTIKADAYAQRSAPRANWTKRWFRRYRQYLSFLRECQEYIASHLEEHGAPDFIQTVVGFVETDRGLGLVTRAERDCSGAYAKTLAQLIADDQFTEEAQQALEKFLQAFLASKVIVTDLGIKNLVYAYHAVHGSHFVIIDGYGEKNLIPLNTLFQWCNLRSKRKRINRFRKNVLQAIHARQLSVRDNAHSQGCFSPATQ